MAGYSKLVVVGHLTRDPELRFTTGGKAVANATIAINRKFRSSTGEAKEDVVFLDFVCFGERAEVFCKWLTKGKRVLLDGQLSQDNWEDKQTGQSGPKSKCPLSISPSLTLWNRGTKANNLQGKQRHRGRSQPHRPQGPTTTMTTFHFDIMSILMIAVWLLLSSLVGAMLLSVVAGASPVRKESNFWRRTGVLMYPCAVTLVLALIVFRLVEWIFGN